MSVASELATKCKGKSVSVIISHSNNNVVQILYLANGKGEKVIEEAFQKFRGFVLGYIGPKEEPEIMSYNSSSPSCIATFSTEIDKDMSLNINIMRVSMYGKLIA